MNENQTGLAVETIGLTKRYKGKAAVHKLNLKVRQGAIYGFIGKNGAGKSTTLKMLCGLAKPTEGEVRIFDKPSNDPLIPRRMGTLIEAPGLYPGMTARQNVVMKARCMGLAGNESIDKVLERTGLADTGKKKVRQFSMGMKQRLGIALALLGNPDLLVLDEPINGLDPEGIREIRELLLSLNEEGKTILISSHILGELSKIATHYGIIRDGELVEQMSSQTLEEKCKDYFMLEVDDTKRALPILLERLPGLDVEVYDGRTLRVYGINEGAALTKILVEAHIPVYAAGFYHMDLEEYFLEHVDEGRNGL